MTLPKIKYAIVFNRLKRTNSILEKPIEIRAYQTGFPAKFISTNIKIDPNYWDSKNKRVKLDHPNSLVYNKTIYNLLFELQDFENKMINRNGSFCVENIREFSNKSNKEYISFKEYCYDDLKAREENPSANKRTLRSKRMHVKTFFEKFNKGKEVFFDTLDTRLIKKYDRFLKGWGYAQNTIHNYHKTIKAYINQGRLEKYTNYNPYDEYKVSRGRDENVKREFLTLEELQRIEQLQFSSEEKSLQRIQEFILICLYCGLRFSDANTLAPEHIKETKEGLVILKLKSEKASKRIFLPLWLLGPKNKEGLTKPEQLFKTLLERREKEVGKDKTFDKIPFFGRSNQKVNKPLKVIAQRAGITKNMTTHIGRRSFTNIMSKDFKIPLPTVQQLLQHSDIRTTMKYVNRGDEAIINELKKANINW